jgi:hypothetical protein
MDKAAFLSKRADEQEETVTLPSGGDVVIRALTLEQVQECKKRPDNEAALIAAALRQPAVTYEEAVTWLAQAPMGDYVAITDAVLGMSGAAQESPKSRMGKSPKRRR